MISLRILFITLFAALVVACGGGGGDDDDDGSPAPTANNDRRAAITMRMDEDAIPEGWTRQSLAGDYGDDALDACIADPAAATTAKEKSGDFSPDLSSSAIEHVIMFATAAEAAAALDEIEARATCILELYESGDADTSVTTFSNPQQEDLETLDFGDGAAAFRIVVDGVRSGGIITDATVYHDFVYVVVGRALLVTIGLGFVPFDQAALEDFTQIAVERAGAELGVTVSDPRGDRPDGTDEPDVTQPWVSSDGTTDFAALVFGEIGAVGNVSVRVISVDFDAEEEVLAENSFNDPAAPGRVMVMALVEITNNGTEPINVDDDITYSMIGALNEEYPWFDPGCGVTPNEIEGDLEPGESRQGNVCVQPAVDDSDLALAVQVYADEVADDETIYLALE